MEPFASWFAEKGLTKDFTVTVSGHLLSVFPVAPGLLALPVFALPVLCGALPQEILLHNLSKISASLICTLSVAIFYKIVYKRATPRWAAWVTLLYAFGTYTLSVSSQSLYQHGPAQLGVVLGLWGMMSCEQRSRSALVAGLGFGLATACRPDSIFFLAAGALYYFLHCANKLPAYLAGAGIPLALTAAYWLHYTGELRPPESHFQAAMFGGLQWEALIAMLVSPTRGILFFTPAAIFGFWGMRNAWRGGERSIPYLLIAIAATWVFFGFRTTWSAGQTFGNRYFAGVCLVLTLFCAQLEQDIGASRATRLLWAAACVCSVTVHMTGAFFTWPGSYAIITQKSSLWNLSLWPPLNLVQSSGALGSLPISTRVLAACALTSASIWTTRQLFSSLNGFSDSRGN